MCGEKSPTLDWVRQIPRRDIETTLPSEEVPRPWSAVRTGQANGAVEVRAGGSCGEVEIATATLGVKPAAMAMASTNVD